MEVRFNVKPNTFRVIHYCRPMKESLLWFHDKNVLF